MMMNYNGENVIDRHDECCSVPVQNVSSVIGNIDMNIKETVACLEGALARLDGSEPLVEKNNVDVKSFMMALTITADRSTRMMELAHKLVERLGI